MSWLQVKLVVPGTFADELSDLCLEVGAVSAVLDNAGADSLAEAVLEPDPGATIVWKRAVITAFWPATSDLASISSVLANHIHDKSIFAEVTVDFIADSELAGAAPQQVAELSFGDGRLWLIPRGAEPRAQDAAPCIKLDPGLAFGSGLHPTTQLCLDYMARMSGWEGLRLLDFGCGSGVLALGALALGAREAHGVDHDPQALVATQDNAAYNDLGDAMQVFTPAELPDNAHYEVVVANILANPLIELAGQISARVSSGGQLVLAGLLAEQADRVQAAYPEFEFETPMVYQTSAIAQEVALAFSAADASAVPVGGLVASPDEDWVCLAGIKNGVKGQA